MHTDQFSLYRYQELSEQHFNGGYFSDAVREQGERFKALSEEEQRAFFADTFNTAYAATQQVRAHSNFKGEAIDLSEYGLGIVTVDAIDEPADEEDPAYKGLLVRSEAFGPTPVRRSVWINHPSDPLGLETAGPTMIQVDQEPANWGETICANPDGSFHDTSNFFGDLDIDTEIMRLLDAKETLDVITDVLGLQIA
jgi:hypothetical protein